MRVISFLLSIYIAALSIVPCIGEVYLGPAHDNTVEASVDVSDHNHSEQKDDCTPFCVCTCCGITTTLPTQLFIVERKARISTEYIFEYIFEYSFDYSDGVWRPPTLS